jgi:hypothetical protein
MESRPFSEDTLADKVVRFVVGAFVGAITAGGLLFYWDFPDRWLRVLAVGALVVGLLAVLVGNRLVEDWVEDRGVWKWLKW